MAGRATVIHEASRNWPTAFAREADDRWGADGRDRCANDADELTAAQGHAFQQDVTG
jgi:hypothetical protein